MKKLIIVLVTVLISACSGSESIDLDCGCVKETFRTWESVGGGGYTIVTSESLSKEFVDCQEEDYTSTDIGYFTITCE